MAWTGSNSRAGMLSATGMMHMGWIHAAYLFFTMLCSCPDLLPQCFVSEKSFTMGKMAAGYLFGGAGSPLAIGESLKKSNTA